MSLIRAFEPPFGRIWAFIGLFIACSFAAKDSVAADASESRTSAPAKTQPFPAVFVPPPLAPPQPFISARADFGYKFLRPRLSLGYGTPFNTWWGLDVNPLISASTLGGYAGLRVATPYVNVRTGLIRFWSFDRSFLPIQQSYNRQDAEFVGDGQATYGGASTELTLTLPLLGGALLSETEAIGLTGVEDDKYVYVDSLNVVSDPSWLLRQRVGYLYRSLSLRGLRYGALAEVIHLPGRSAQIWRAGPIARWRLYRSLEVRFVLAPVISSPDALGIVGGDFLVGLRWFWSSAAW